MTLRDHTILGGGASIVLYPFIGLNVLWFFCATVLIDIDHYLDFIYHNGLKDLSVRRMFSYHNTLTRWWRSPSFLNVEVFHTAEVIFLVFALALILSSLALWALFFGLIFHILLDVIFLIRHGILNKRAHSMTEYFIRKRMMARAGHDPAELYRKAVEEVSKSPGLKTLAPPLKNTNN